VDDIAGHDHDRIEAVLQSHHFRAGEALETTLHRYLAFCNQQLPRSALGRKTPLQVMKDWHRPTPVRFRKLPYHLSGCDIRRPSASDFFTCDSAAHGQGAKGGYLAKLSPSPEAE